jgi:hypothetical protein
MKISERVIKSIYFMIAVELPPTRYYQGSIPHITSNDFTLSLIHLQEESLDHISEKIMLNVLF